jgi:5,10-methylenetetrahydromethanopterin reductase
VNVGVDVSIGISPREPLNEWMNLSAELERRGVHRIWLIDSHLAMKDVYAGLLTAALATERVELGPGVTNFVTRDPTVTASAMAALAEVSGGRALLGIGAGDSAVRALGRRPSRISELEDGLRLLRTLLDGNDARWEGRTYRLPYGVPRVRLYLAVSRPRMCRLAGRLADGAIIMGPAQPEMLSEQVQWVQAGIEAAGRSVADVELSFVAPTSVNADVGAALDDVRSWASAQARLLADVEQLPATLAKHRHELEQAREGYDYSEHLSTRAGHQATVSDALVGKLAIAGPTDHCRERLRRLRGTGIDSLIFPLMPPRIKRLDELCGLLDGAPGEPMGKPSSRASPVDQPLGTLPD